MSNLSPSQLSGSADSKYLSALLRTWRALVIFREVKYFIGDKLRRRKVLLIRVCQVFFQVCSLFSYGHGTCSGRHHLCWKGELGGGQGRVYCALTMHSRYFNIQYLIVIHFITTCWGKSCCLVLPTKDYWGPWSFSKFPNFMQLLSC